MMETITKVINIEKPCLIGKESVSYKDWGEYNKNYRNILDDELSEIFSEIYNKLCMKYGKRLGRTSWLDIDIKYDKRQYVFKFWDIGDTSNDWNHYAALSGAEPEHESDIMAQLIININWLGEA